MSTYRDFINEMYIQGYSLAEDAPTFRVPENFDRYQRGNGWEAYRGGNDWEHGSTGVAVYLNPEGFNKDMARIWFEVCYPPELAEAVSNPQYGDSRAMEVKRWGDKAAKKWVSETAKIHKASRYQINPQMPNGRWYYKKWYECFIEALGSEVMKPYVKNFGVDRTKWVGMKRCQVNEQVVTDKSSKSWWMDPQGELEPVACVHHNQHNLRGRELVKKQQGIDLSQDKSVYDEMHAMGYIRVEFAGIWGQYVLIINYDKSRPPTYTQWKALKDLAIEMGAEEIKDRTNRRDVRVDESRMLFENFYENKDFFVYEGSNTVTAVFEDNTRHSFKINYRDNRNEDRQKHAAKAARTWKRLAMEIRKGAGLTEVGNPIVIPWQECFKQALEDPIMKEFVDDMRSVPVFEMILPKHLEPLQEQVVVREMTYDELLASTAKFQSLRDKEDGIANAGKERIKKGEKEVKAKSLRVASTIGPEGKEYETSTFSYKSYPHNPNNDPRRARPRWQGYIRFLERFDKGSKGDVQVNCNCPDYQYVWAKSNADAGAGVTGDEKNNIKPMQHHTQVAGRPSGQNIFEVGNLDPEQPEQSEQPTQTSAEQQPQSVDYSKKFKGGNANNNTYGKDLRNPDRTPGLCKHLVALAKFLDTASSPVAPASGKKDGSPVAPASSGEPKKPVNIFENMKAFAKANPTFEVPYN